MPDHEFAFIRCFADVPDPRVNRSKKHALSDILGVTPRAGIYGPTFSRGSSGSGTLVDWLEQYFLLVNGRDRAAPRRE